MNYGTRDWLESQYAATADDPWGLDWRASQRYRYQVMLDALAAAAPPAWQPGTVVDIGCATGGFTAMLAAAWPAARVHGADIAAAAVSRAAQRYPRIAFERLGIDEAGARHQGAADLVTCLEVLYYLPRPERAGAMRQLAGMLRPGGFLLVSSMIAGGQYMGLAELSSLAGAGLEVVATGTLYLKPVTFWEKLMMRLGAGGNPTGARPVAREAMARVARQAALAERVMGAHAASHGYVIARKAIASGRDGTA
jgi:2-polyprenyl-3-methyl-5-hydroxy-6-metoxy-1,4-benzoquinol methylase